jgi:uncharacterized protein (TIGR02646 family)
VKESQGGATNMTFDKADRALIDAAIAQGGDIWNNETLADIKQRIKAHYRLDEGGHCCYCRRRFKGEFKLDIDIEHVLPKSKFVDFIFQLFNLNISCKRCNMWIKKERIDFLIDASTILQNCQQSDQYQLIHPNFDQYFDHMDLDVLIRNETEMVKFTPKKPKGVYTYDFFKLNELEIDTMNKAQGIKDAIPEQLLPGLPEDMQSDARNLVEELNPSNEVIN